MLNGKKQVTKDHLHYDTFFIQGRKAKLKSNLGIHAYDMTIFKRQSNDWDKT